MRTILSLERSHEVASIERSVFKYIWEGEFKENLPASGIYLAEVLAGA